MKERERERKRNEPLNENTNIKCINLSVLNVGNV